MEINFATKTALVPGAAHGIGQAIVHGLASRGAKVWACDILDDELQSTVSTITSPGGENVYLRALDVTDGEAVAILVAEASVNGGQIDILVHCAG